MFFKSGLYIYEPIGNVPAIALIKSALGVPSLTDVGSIRYDGHLRFLTSGAGDIILDSVDGLVRLADDNYFGVSKVAALPAASATYLQRLICVLGNHAGPPPTWTDDHLYICLQDSLGVYNWVQLS